MLVLFFIYRPLKKIIRGAQEYASGNLDYNIPWHSGDEMGYLAQTLNYMSDELKRTDEYQRKFVANVSHDFRSPLTSIKGYVEAILDGTIPPEMQEKYLNIVLFEADRLNKLTRSMLALNRMDNKGFYLDIRDFDINTVIKNTAASFEGTCTAKRISIELLLSAEKLYVSADKMKIQQVLYNLIDNAIKFSPNHSTIRVETTERHDKVFVSVKDNGIGIPRASLSKIWRDFTRSTPPGERTGRAPDWAFPSSGRSSAPTNRISTSSARKGSARNLSFPGPGQTGKQPLLSRGAWKISSTEDGGAVLLSA